MQIMVNGQQYDSWDAVPADIKQQLAAKLPDADGNGVPDLFEGGGLAGLTGLSGLTSAPTVITSTSFGIDGQTYDSVAALPPEIQNLLRSVLPGALGAATAAAGAVPPPAVPTTPAPTTAAAASTTRPLAEGEIMLNGVPTRIGEEPAKKKRWWQRG